MHVLCTGFVGVPREIGDVETQCGIIAQDTVEVAEESPGESRAAEGGALGDDCAVADSAASFVQGRAKDGQEDYRCNDRLEHEEVLNLDSVSQVLRAEQGLIAESYLRVRNAQERKLEQEIEQKSNHSSCRDTLAGGYSVVDVGKARPDGCEQDGHALPTSRGLNTEPDNGKDAARQDDEVAEVVTEGHACEHRERSVKLFTVSSTQASEESDSQ